MISKTKAHVLHVIFITVRRNVTHFETIFLRSKVSKENLLITKSSSPRDNV